MDVFYVKYFSIAVSSQKKKEFLSLQQTDEIFVGEYRASLGSRLQPLALPQIGRGLPICIQAED